MKKLLSIFMILSIAALFACTAAKGTPEDGQYTIEVTLTGGSGRASVSSPAQVMVSNGVMTARITWSSPYYDSMLVDGEAYLPVNTKGNSTFVIPIAALDQDIAISAETTAMSQPHMIDYSLYFDSTTFRAGTGQKAWIILAAADTMGVVVMVIITSKRQKSRRDAKYGA